MIEETADCTLNITRVQSANTQPDIHPHQSSINKILIHPLKSPAGNEISPEDSGETGRQFASFIKKIKYAGSAVFSLVSTSGLVFTMGDASLKSSEGYFIPPLPAFAGATSETRCISH